MGCKFFGKKLKYSIFYKFEKGGSILYCKKIYEKNGINNQDNGWASTWDCIWADIKSFCKKSLRKRCRY